MVAVLGSGSYCRALDLVTRCEEVDYQPGVLGYEAQYLIGLPDTCRSPRLGRDETVE